MIAVGWLAAGLAVRGGLVFTKNSVIFVKTIAVGWLAAGLAVRMGLVFTKNSVIFVKMIAVGVKSKFVCKFVSAKKSIAC